MTVTTRRLRTVEGPSHRQHRPTVPDLVRFGTQDGLDDMKAAIAILERTPCPRCDGTGRMMGVVKSKGGAVIGYFDDGACGCRREPT